jgi:hypothetical protein
MSPCGKILKADRMRCVQSGLTLTPARDRLLAIGASITEVRRPGRIPVSVVEQYHAAIKRH